MSDPLDVIVLGVGAFTHGVMRALADDGAKVRAFLTRNYGHYGPRLAGECWDASQASSPLDLPGARQASLFLPMSLEWALKPWTAEVLDSGVPILCPTGEGLRLERERDCARALCERFGVPFPRSYFAANGAEALHYTRRHPAGYVLKNPLCAPNSPLHTIACETVAETEAWIRRVDDREGIFLQEYLGRREAGHIALVSAGELYSLVTNQEYKRAFDGNQGIVAGAPLGGLVEADPEDRYGLAAELLRPLLPWFREVRFHGPVQVTAMRHRDRWHVLEYNVRLGVTSGPMLSRMLKDPASVFLAAARNLPLRPVFKPGLRFGCSLTLAGYGYPFTSLEGPEVPVEVRGPFSCDVWWNEVRADSAGAPVATGHRVADVCALAGELEDAIALAYENIRRIRVMGSYFRTDVGRSLWPPGSE